MTTPIERAYAALRTFRPELIEATGPRSIAGQRRNLEDSAPPPAPDAVHEPVAAAPGLFTTVPGSASGRVVLLLHGGGYHTGSSAVQRELAARIARATGAGVLGVDYPLAPEDPFPAGVLTARKAYEWLLGTGHDPRDIAILGDSAGGGLTLATLVGLRDLGLPLPSSAAVMSPWTDLAMTGESFTARAHRDPFLDPAVMRTWAASYLAGADPRDPLASPLYADLTGLPPLLIQVGTEEILYDDSLRLADTARAAGVDVTLDIGRGMPHIWQIFAAFLPEAAAAIDRIGQHIRSHR